MIIEVNGKRPRIGDGVYVAPNAMIIGDVTIGDNASIWFGAVIRGDEGKISIGPRTSVQDNVVIHVNAGATTLVEADVTLAHGAVIEGCHLERGALVGMNATVLTGAHVGQYACVAAGSVVLENQEIPANHLATGIPSKVVKAISGSLKDRIAQASEDYGEIRRQYSTSAKIVSS